MAILRYGGLYFSTPTETTLSAATPAKAAGTTTALPLSGFSHSNGRITYSNATTRDYLISTSISATKAVGSATVGSFYLYKNGNPISGAVIGRTLSNTTDVGSISLTSLISLANNDYVEIWVATVNGNNITVQNATMTATVAG